MSGFLPDGYALPEKYYTFKDGENRFRIVANAIVGNEYWNELNKPVRQRMGKPINIADLRVEKDGSQTMPKHFWAFPVLDLDDNQIKVLQIKQKGLQKSIKDLSASKAWGSPLGYNLVVNKTGSGMTTEYTVMPEPKEDLPEFAQKQFKQMVEGGFDLDRLYDGGDPFTGTAVEVEEEVVVEEPKKVEVITERKRIEKSIEEEAINIDDLPF